MISVTIDPTRNQRKPTMEEATFITGRLRREEMSVSDLAEVVVQPYGLTWCPGVFNQAGTRENKAWVQQQVLALDFDNTRGTKSEKISIPSTDSRYMTLERFLCQCQKYNIQPAFCYTSFSHTEEHNKFRAVFILPTPVENYRVWKIFQDTLMRLFPECDPSCKDGARMFFGGKELIHLDEDALLDVESMFNALINLFKEDSGTNFKRNLQRWCQSIGLNTFNGLPHVRRVDEEVRNISEVSKLEESVFLYRYTYKKNTNYSKYDTLEISAQPVKRETRSGTQYKSITNQRTTREYLPTLDQQALYEGCSLFRTFIDGTEDLHHNIKFGIATNLLLFRRGRTVFMEGITKRPENDIKKWETICDQIIAYNYFAQAYENYYPEAAEYTDYRFMFELAKPHTEGKITVKKQQASITLQEAETRLATLFQTVYAAQDTKVYVIKAPTAIGKSRLLKELNNVTIAVPTHNLLDEWRTEYDKFMQEVSLDRKLKLFTPRPPRGANEEIDAIIERLYDVGATGRAYTTMRNYANNGNTEYKEYLDRLDSVRSLSAQFPGAPVYTTHERAMYMETPHSTLIFDEDPFKTLMKISSVRIDDLAAFVELAENDPSIIQTDKRILTSLLSSMTKSEEQLGMTIPPFVLRDMKALEVLAVTSGIRSNVLGFLKAHHFIRDEKNIVHYIQRRSLPRDKKIIILSATADEEMYRYLFGDRLVFMNVGLTQSVGVVEQYTEFSFSRSFMKKGEEAIVALVEDIAGKDTPKITFKTFANDMENTAATFGAAEGLNALTGQDLAVVGTYHLPTYVYLLYAMALGIRPTQDLCLEMRYVPVERNGCEFYFMTFHKEPLLRAIQFYIVESELTQAVGRARHLRHDCKVTVFSNYPYPGATYRSLPGERKREIRTEIRQHRTTAITA